MMPPIPDLDVTEPDLYVDGRRVFFAWAPPAAEDAHRHGPYLSAKISGPSIPYGAFVEHLDKQGRPCISWLPWANAGDGTPWWTLVSLHPLTIGEPFVCSRCGAFGSIRDSHWFIGTPR